MTPADGAPKLTTGRDAVELAKNAIRAALELLDYAEDCDGICHVLRNKPEFKALGKALTALDARLARANLRIVKDGK